MKITLRETVNWAFDMTVAERKWMLTFHGLYDPRDSEVVKARKLAVYVHQHSKEGK